MTTEAGQGEGSSTAQGGSGTCTDPRFEPAIKALQVASAKAGAEKEVLDDWVRLLTDVCVLMSGFGAALKAKAKSR